MAKGEAGPPGTIYKATYSSVPVYEMPCHGVAVMRRKSDSWLNATQILKVAGFDKPQRTRVLEREVQKGTHEKVQGGYGKYQGTWVPMDRGIALSRQYGVDRLLQPIFDYIPTADSPPLAPKHITAAPSARPKKKGDFEESVAPASATKTARVATNKANAARKAAEFKRQQQMDERAMDESDDDLDPINLNDSNVVGSDGRSLSPTPSEVTSSSETPSPLGSEHGDFEYQEGGAGQNGAVSKKRKHQELSGNGGGGGGQMSAHAQLGGGPLRYARMILDYFVSESTQVPSFLVNPPGDFDPNVVIDDDGHTALHWACAMGRIRIVKLLLTAGADIFRANSMGQTALMRSVMFTNNYDLRKFPELFELLHRSTINIDRNDRTVFHYIVDIALQKGKTHAARYYIETVLGRLVDYPKEVADILNFQDEEGETVLTLAARARSKRLVKILLDNGADPKIANRDGKTAEDYILEDERFRETEAGANNSTIPLLGPGGVPMAYGGGAVGGAGGSHAHPHSQVNMSSSFGGGGGAGTGGAIYVHPQLHTSEVGQRTSSKCIPLATELLENLAQSFDSELAAKDRDITSALGLLANIEAETIESQRIVQGLQQQASGNDLLVAREEGLVKELENKMGKRFRLGWEKWVRDEDARESEYEASGGSNGVEVDLEEIKNLVKNPPSDHLVRSQAFRAEIEQLREERRTLFNRFATLQSESGTGVKMGQYRQLIALGCGVGMEQVDGVIGSLVETLDGRDEATGFA